MNALIIYQNILFMIIGKAIPITTEEPTNTQSLLLTLKKVCMQTFFKVSKRDWVLVGSSVVIGIAFPMIINRIFW